MSTDEPQDESQPPSHIKVLKLITTNDPHHQAAPRRFPLGKRVP